MTALRLAQLFAQASSGDHEQGLKSYPCYHGTLRRFANFYNAPFVQTVEAFAALSPNNDFHGNLRSLASVLVAYHGNHSIESVTVSTYRACARRALQYLNGEVSFHDTVKGRKIISFRHNILYPESSRLVTVDGHLLNAWFGDSATMVNAQSRMNKSVYDHVERAVINIASKAKYPVPATQAVLWIAHKRRKGIKYDPQINLFTGETNWTGILDPQHFPPYARRT